MKQPSIESAEKLAFDLGALFLNFGILEHTLSLTLAAAFGLTDLQERTFVRGMFARAKVELLLSFAKKNWNNAFQAQLKQMATDTLGLIDYRNDFAHGTIMHDADGNWSVIHFRGGNRFDGAVVPIDAKVLSQRVRDTIAYATAFQLLANDVEAGKAKRPA